MSFVKRIALVALVVVLLPVLPAAAVTVERVVSDQGIEAWLVQDHTNPILSLQLAFRGGAALDPQGKAGLANMASGLLDEGAGDLESFAFQKALEDQAIHLRFAASRDAFYGSLKTLTENRAAAFDMLRLALTQPRFDEEPVERIRSQILAGLKRELQDPNSIAGRAWDSMQFPGHPYGSAVSGTPDTVTAITADDLRSFAATRLGRDRLFIGVVGDITPAELKPLLDATFAALPAGTGPVAVADVQPAAPGKVKVIEQDNPQSVVVFGHQGIARSDPDWYAAYTLNYILGGGSFASRLMEEVREKRGLAYSVYSYLNPLDHAPLIVGGVATQNARVAESLDLIRAEWKRMAEQGPTADELKNAKTYLTGSFPLQLDSTASIASVLVAMQLDDLGLDYLDKRSQYIDSVSLDDIRRIAARLLKPEHLAVVVVGKPEGLATN